MRGAITSTDLQYIRREALYCSLLLLLSAALLRPLVKLQEKYHHAVAGSSKHDDILHSLREANAAFHEIVLAPTAPGILKDKPSSSLDGKSSRDEHVQSPNITIHGMSSSDQEHVAEHFFTNKAAPNKTIIMTENQSHEQQNYSLLEETELEANATRQVRRVAICIAGHARSLHRPTVYKSIYQNLVVPLHSAFDSVDIFFHVGLQDVPRENTSAAAAAPQQYFEAMRYFGPVSISVFDNDLPSTADHGASSTCRDESVPLAEKFPSSLWRAAECVHRIANYEWSNRLHYDWIIKTRPDVALLDPLTEIADLRSDRVYLNQHIPGKFYPIFFTADGEVLFKAAEDD